MHPETSQNEGRMTGANKPQPTKRIVTALAANVLGSPKNAKAWLNTPNAALGSKKPADLLSTQAGMNQVCSVLYAIQYGGAV